MLVWSNVALIGCVWQGLPWLLPQDLRHRPWLRALGGVSLFVMLQILFTLLAGINGMLNGLTLAMLPTITWGALALALPKTERLPWLYPPRDPWAAAGVFALVCSLAIWWAGPGWTGTRFVFDDITYHASVPAIWVQWQTIDHTNLSYQAYYPFDAELMGLWFATPERHFGHAGLAVLLTVALVITACGAIAEELDAHPGPLLTLLAAILAGKPMLFFARTYSANDLTMAAFLLGMLAFTIPRPSVRSALWAGALAGAAVGTKVSAAPMVVLCGLVWLWRTARAPRFVTGFVAASLPLGAYWYLHNWAQTGNPLFPADIGPFEGPLDEKTQFRTTLAYFFSGKKPWSRELWRTVLTTRLDWPVGVGFLAVLGYVRGLGDLGRRRGILLLWAAGALFVMLHPFQPFSGTINRPASPLHEMHRYVAFPVLIGVLLMGLTRWHRLATAVAILTWGSVIGGAWRWYGTTEIRFVALFGVIAAILLAFRARPFRHGLLAALALVAVLAWRTDAKQERTLHNTRTATRHVRYHTKAFKAVDALPDGSSLAWISDLPPSHAFNLPNLGSRLQHSLVPLDFDGRRVDRPLHERWRDGRKGGWWGDFKREHKREVPVLRNVLDSGADFLVLSRCQQSKKGGWPVPRGALMRSGPRHRAYAGRCTEIWKLEPLRGTELREPIRRRPTPKPRPKPKPRPTKEAPK